MSKSLLKKQELHTDFTAFQEVDEICFEKCFPKFFKEMKGSQEVCFGKHLFPLDSLIIFRKLH